MDWLSIHDRYAIGPKVGAGGTGTVYVGLRLPEREIVAIKLLNPTDRAEEIDRFLRSARLSSRLAHDNLCRVLDYGMSEDRPPGDGRAFLAMELLGGVSVAKLLKDDWPYADEDTRIATSVRVVGQVLRGLQAAHEVSVIHRDIKPSNIVVGQSSVSSVKVIDFDNLRIRDQGSYTAPNMVRGSAHYLSPEQITASEDQDHRVDIWATGVLLYECLTLKRPFEGKTRREVKEKIAGGVPFDPPHTRNPRIPTALEDIIGRALARLPSDRFRTAAEMEEALLSLKLDDELSLPAEDGEFATMRLLPLKDLEDG